ncbi:MAG: transcription-repair coupling factor [Bacteroidia bacterium]
MAQTSKTQGSDTLLAHYVKNRTIFDFAKTLEQYEFDKFQIKGAVGSQMAFLISALHQLNRRHIVIILGDKEEALYFHNDLKLLLPTEEIHYYPASYKRPYQVEEVDNANVLQRADVLNQLNHSQSNAPIIVTFAEALHEKIISRRSLVKNTFEVKLGDACGMDFLVDILDKYGFERVDFVFEPGQFSVRGGILDIFSFSNEQPYRLEFFGEEIDKIKVFDLNTQLSEAELKQISLIPNIQTNLITEDKINFLSYISPKSLVFLDNLDFIQTDLDRLFEKARAHYERLQKVSGGGGASKKPELLYVNSTEFLQEIGSFGVVEFGNKQFFKQKREVLTWNGTGQPSFRKEFALMATHLLDNQRKEIQNFVFSDNETQFVRLTEIFEAIEHKSLFQPILGEIHEGFVDTQLNLACYTDHQIFDRYHRYKVKSKAARSQALTLKELRELKSGDYVTHINHGIGRFMGLHKVQVGENWQEAIKIIFAGDDEVLVNVNALHKVAKFVGKDGTEPKLSKLGSQTWEKAKAKTKQRVKTLAFDLVNLYAMRKAQKGFAFTPDSYLQQELEASFMYEDTPDQVKVTEEVKIDMEQFFPMDRLVCGDVGFGKTEIAVRAAFKAVCDGKQVAILVPTTILALQHYKTFAERLRNFPVTVDYVNRFKSSQAIKDTLQNVAQGKVDILVGTHRLVSKDVIFKDLGLLIIDEEQRFGVGVKEKLRTMKINVDTLTLTATPIPRTLQFSLAGIRDLSVISTAPPNRQAIETIVTSYDAVQLRDAISYELKRGGQVFLIHPRVKDIEEVASMILKLVPDARIKVAHGQMGGEKLEEVMSEFIEGAFDVLVSTTIVESGLDIPNANTIIINEANKYGLSELHQMRGRVGRSNRKAFCYLIVPSATSLTSDAKKRLKAMEDFSDLGGGFHIAMRDMDIRGSGDLLGADQTGFIAEIGAEMYNKILDEAVQELKEEHFADLFQEEIKKRKAIMVDDVQVDLEADIRIPEGYLPSVAERLNFYRKIAFAENEAEFEPIQREMIDRFGPLPKQVLNLFDATRIREAAKRCGIEKVSLKGNVLKMFLISNQNSSFYQNSMFERIMAYVSHFGGKISIKQTPKSVYLLRDEIHGIKDVLFAMTDILNFAKNQEQI